jgi:DNA-binding transcriptional ArsR family regulator
MEAHDALFRTLADPTRRAIFERLCRDGEQSATAPTAKFWESKFDRLEDLLKRMDQ